MSVLSKNSFGMKTLSQNEVPLISVAMPVYNGEKYLAEAIDSILAQTFTNFEFIIIDDGSTDASLKVLREYQKCDTRVRLIARENRNLATTLNDIVELAQGKWVARMDQDDIALPHRFERQLEWLESTGADICGSWIKLFGTRDKRIIKHPQSDDAVKMELLFGTSFAHPTVMMKTELVRKLCYDPAWDKAEDYELWVRAACVGWKMTNVPEVLLMYRQHNTQISTASSAKQQQLAQKIRCCYWDYVFGKMQLNKKWIDAVLNLREPSPLLLNMSDVDLAFNALLQRNQGEARDVVFGHITRLYFRAASTCPDITVRWKSLHTHFGNGLYMPTIIKLWFLSMCHIDSKSKAYGFLKKLYFYLIRSI